MRRKGKKISSDNATILMPKAQIVIKAKNGKLTLNDQPKFTTVSSNNINHRPLVNKKRDNSFLVFRCPTKKAEVPAKNINTGAQKWVIHLVRNNTTLVLERSVGS